MATKVYFCVSLDDSSQAEAIAQKVQELLSRPLGELKEEPPKLKVSSQGYKEEYFSIYPEVLLVEKEIDRDGKRVLKGSVVGSSMKFEIVIS